MKSRTKKEHRQDGIPTWEAKSETVVPCQMLVIIIQLFLLKVKKKFLRKRYYKYL